MWLEKKYINLLSSSLKLFKSAGENTWKFRCPICGDSQSDKTKTRGYLLFKRGSFYSYCHNCHASMSFGKFLETVNEALFVDYIREKYETEPKKRVESLPPVQRRDAKSNEILKKIQKVSLLKHDHHCKEWVVRRQIPSFWHSRLYYAPDFAKFANRLVEDDKFSDKRKEPRLVIPLFDETRKIFGVQGRSLLPVEDRFKYMTALVAPDNPRFFNLDLCNFAKTFYILEGPIDSMFIQNSIAVCGGAIHSELKKHGTMFPQPNVVAVYDNEPRNKDVVRNMLKVARRGYKIVIWPESIQDKDINEMVLTKVGTHDIVRTELVQSAAEYIQNIMEKNTYVGLEAEARIAEWRRC